MQDYVQYVEVDPPWCIGGPGLYPYRNWYLLVLLCRMDAIQVQVIITVISFIYFRLLISLS